MATPTESGFVYRYPEEHMSRAEKEAEIGVWMRYAALRAALRSGTHESNILDVAKAYFGFLRGS